MKKIETIFLIDETKQPIYLEKIMIFPSEIQTIINQYAKPASAMLREDWREGSSIIKILKQDNWWIEYRRGCGRWDGTMNWSWVEWCENKMIIGPPRRPWSRKWPKWPEPIDISWCEVRKVPDWAIREFIEARAFC